MSWVLAGTEEGMNARDIFVFAMEQGGENEQLEDNEFYVVSAEGAIGFTTKYEYLTRWLFIPTEGDFKEAEMQRLKNELEFDHQQEKAAAKEAARAAAAAQEAVPAPAHEPVQPQYHQPAPEPMRSETPAAEPRQAVPQPSFCYNCGKPISPGAKFCRNCGTKLG